MKKMHFLLLVTACCFMLGPVRVSADCNIDITPTKPDSIYTDNGDGTVTDNETGLMWKKCPEGLSGSACDSGFIATYTWQMALRHVERLNAGEGFAGYADWRLPNHKELRSLAELQCFTPAINSNFFPNTLHLVTGLPFYYWTSSSYVRSRDRFAGRSAWAVGFNLGSSVAHLKSGTGFVRLVRSEP